MFKYLPHKPLGICCSTLPTYIARQHQGILQRRVLDAICKIGFYYSPLVNFSPIFVPTPSLTSIDEYIRPTLSVALDFVPDADPGRIFFSQGRLEGWLCLLDAG